MADRTFPKPGVGVLIVRGGRLLFARRKHPPAQGELDIIGGFVEPGESAEAAVVREVKEETGLDVANVEYLGSAPDVYGDTGIPTLNLIYVARVPDDAAPIAADDVSAVEWWPLDALPDRMAFPHQTEALGMLRAWGARNRPPQP